MSMDWTESIPFGKREAKNVSRWVATKKRKGYGTARRNSKMRSASQARNKGPLGSKGFKKNRKKGRHVKRKKFSKTAGKPAWFKTILHMNTPAKMAGQYVGQVTAAINQKANASFWAHLGVMDINNVGHEAIQNAASNANAGTKALLTTKAYLFDLVRRHQWRNAEQNATVHVTAYMLYPRKDIPRATSDTGDVLRLLPQFAPTPTNSSALAGNGWGIQDPSGWTQPFSDEAGGTVYTTKIAPQDPAVTPFQNPIVTNLFKIKKLMMDFPDGRKSAGLLEPGQTLRYVGKRTKPINCELNKYSIDGAFDFEVGRNWQCLTTTPLIWLQVKGTTSHDTTTKTIVGLGPATLDYVQDFSFQYVITATGQCRISNPITNAPVVAAAEQVEMATASVGIESLA